MRRSRKAPARRSSRRLHVIQSSLTFLPSHPSLIAGPVPGTAGDSAADVENCKSREDRRGQVRVAFMRRGIREANIGARITVGAGVLQRPLLARPLSLGSNES